MRNPKFCAPVGAVVGLVAVYFAWVWYFLPLSGWQGTVFEPRAVYQLMKEIGQVGVWEIKGGRPTGWGLYSIWIAEAALVVGLAMMGSSAIEQPFCEYCKLWTKPRDIDHRLVMTDPVQLRTDLEEERYEALDALRGKEVDLNQFIAVKYYACPNCSDSNYLTVSQVINSQNAKGEVVTKNTPIVDRLRVPPDVWAMLTAPLPEPAASEAESLAASESGELKNEGAGEEAAQTDAV